MKLPHHDILRALVDCWKEWSSSEQPITADGNIVDWIKHEGWWQDIDVMDVRWAVSRHFGANIPINEWHSFFSGEALFRFGGR